MRVSDLAPEFRAGVQPANLFEFSMNCPVCGLRLSFRAWWQAGPSDGFHGMTATIIPPLDWDTLTVQPSLQYGPGSAHGRKSACTPHFTITNGNVSLRGSSEHGRTHSR